MAIIVPILGDLSGKIGGNVFAHNKGGSYVRQWKKPTNPKTNAQQLARAAFASAASLWAGCSAVQKAAYETFAGTLFNPLNARVGVVYSGQQSCVALDNVCTNNNRLIRATTMKLATVSCTNTYGTFAPTVVAPAYRALGQITSAASGPINLTLSQATVHIDGKCQFKLNGDQNFSAAPTFKNVGASDFCGFVFYLSNPLGPNQKFVRNKYHTIVASTGPILSCSVTIVTPSPAMEIDFNTADFDPSKYKNWFTVGNLVRASAFLVTANGQVAFLGSYDSAVQT
jgi:hypothetical protein